MKNITDKYQDYIAFKIDYASNFNKTFRRLFHNKYMSKEVTADEFAILLFLNDNPKVSQKEMAQFLFKGKAHVGKILNTMEIKGLIVRHPQSNNSYINTITEKGKLILQKGNATVEKIIKTKIDQNFTKEEHLQLINLLNKYIETINSIIEVKLK